MTELKVVLKFLAIRDELQLYHWCTDIYSRHIAADELIDHVKEFSDKLVESYQGHYGKIDFKGKHTQMLTHVEDTTALAYVKNLYTYLMVDPNFIEFIMDDSFLVTLRDELIGHINTTIYKFGLK